MKAQGLPSKVHVKEIIPKRLVIECRYPPSLHFYSKMDNVGQSFLTDFPDWQRTALSLELRDRRDHKRAHLSFGRMFFEFNKLDEPLAALDQAVEIYSSASKEFQITENKRLGVRTFYALTFEPSFESLKDKVVSRFFQSSHDIDQMLDGPITDTAYVVDLGPNSAGWEAHLRLGPMHRKQWFEVVPYERELFPPPGDRDPFEQFKKTIPDPMIYVDLDLFRSDVAATDVADKIREAFEIAQTKTRAFVRFYLGK
jgi:hypothetical protein